MKSDEEEQELREASRRLSSERRVRGCSNMGDSSRRSTASICYSLAVGFTLTSATTSNLNLLAAKAAAASRSTVFALPVSSNLQLLSSWVDSACSLQQDILRMLGGAPPRSRQCPTKEAGPSHRLT